MAAQQDRRRAGCSCSCYAPAPIPPAARALPRPLLTDFSVPRRQQNTARALRELRITASSSLPTRIAVHTVIIKRSQHANSVCFARSASAPCSRHCIRAQLQPLRTAQNTIAPATQAFRKTYHTYYTSNPQ